MYTHKFIAALEIYDSRDFNQQANFEMIVSYAQAVGVWVRLHTSFASSTHYTST